MKAGCTTCNGSGYKGRVALYEVMRFPRRLKERVLARRVERRAEASCHRRRMLHLGA